MINDELDERMNDDLMSRCSGKGLLSAIVGVVILVGMVCPSWAGERRRHTREERWILGKVSPSLNMLLGPSFHLPLADHETRFTLDVELGLRYGFASSRGREVVGSLWPVVGYSLDTGVLAGGHLFSAGMGLALHASRIAGALSFQVRFLVGSAGDQMGAMGVRSGLRYELLIGFFAVEISHQLLFVRGQSIHGVRLVFGVDLVEWFRMATEAISSHLAK